MIKDAIVSLKEKNGSSRYAIVKFIKEKQKQLPGNFKKLLLQNLKKNVASGKLVKVKGSFKLSAAAKKPAIAKPKSKLVLSLVCDRSNGSGLICEFVLCRVREEMNVSSREEDLRRK
ncbi:hypothetical protein KIW84_070662 [Lathyrus oleraceus]|uniref:H15 domain-containing protein n=1 Tax=Pisum sativum TaxID=3888 RepID=A0A9D4ZTV7_PEA|nr:hypothetical protein KIW84_070662 [Pisum sativum]